MLTDEEALLTPFARMNGTIAGFQEVRGGKLPHYSSLTIF